MSFFFSREVELAAVAPQSMLELAGDERVDVNCHDLATR